MSYNKIKKSNARFSFLSRLFAALLRNNECGQLEWRRTDASTLCDLQLEKRVKRGKRKRGERARAQCQRDRLVESRSDSDFRPRVRPRSLVEHCLSAAKLQQKKLLRGRSFFVVVIIIKIFLFLYMPNLILQNRLPSASPDWVEEFLQNRTIGVALIHPSNFGNNGLLLPCWHWPKGIYIEGERGNHLRTAISCTQSSFYCKVQQVTQHTTIDV
jgi:hypothetical protein